MPYNRDPEVYTDEHDRWLPVSRGIIEDYNDDCLQEFDWTVSGEDFPWGESTDGRWTGMFEDMRYMWQ